MDKTILPRLLYLAPLASPFETQKPGYIALQRHRSDTRCCCIIYWLGRTNRTRRSSEVRSGPPSKLPPQPHPHLRITAPPCVLGRSAPCLSALPTGRTETEWLCDEEQLDVVACQRSLPGMNCGLQDILTRRGPWSASVTDLIEALGGTSRSKEMEARATPAKELEEKIVSFLARQAEFERRAAFGVADQLGKDDVLGVRSSARGFPTVFEARHVRSRRTRR